jgi:predicted ArsR family transcriptional regulator
VFLVDPLDGIAQPELRAVVLFARAQTRPVSADEVAAHFGIHRSVARGRLDRLAAAGLLQTSFERRTGRSGPGAGRPAKVYGVPPETSALEFPQRHYDRLVGHLVAALPAEERQQALARVGDEFAQDLAESAHLGRARDVRTAAERACAALGRLGFQAAVADASEEQVTITTATCPLRPLVVAEPAAAAIDRGMWTGLVNAHLPRSADRVVDCETCDCLDCDASCRVVLSFPPEKSQTAEDPA